ncbi:nitroreductase [bacterium]|nr:MAG: nitroreductase [bacterium]
MMPKLQEADFPHYGSTETQLRFLLNYAVLAPSHRNSQPWLWEIDADEVVLRADQSRAMPALDPQGRELIMSCGAALQHLCLAIRAFGYAPILRTLPKNGEPNLLARIRLSSLRPASDDDHLLFRFISERHTHRGPFEARQLPIDLLRMLQEDAHQEGASLYFAQDAEEKSEIIELIERSDLIQNRDPAMRRDVANWITPAGKRRDGIPAKALGIGDFASHLAPLAQRYLDRGDSIAQKDRALAECAPVLAVLSTIGEGPQAWLSAGQALGRVLLRARSQEVWASFFSQPIQIDDAWFGLRHLVGVHSFPQLVFRLGYAQPVGATPRRPVSEVVNSI